MEIFLEVIREILKGIVREIAAHVFRKNVLDNKKTTPRELHLRLLVASNNWGAVQKRVVLERNKRI